MIQDPRRLAETYPLLSTLPLRYNDVDRQNHLNNVAIAALYQEARLLLLQAALGPALARFRIVVAEQTLKFFAEGFYPQETVAGSAVARIGRSSYALAHGLFQGGGCIGLCDTVLVNVGEEGRPEPLPPELRAALEPLLLKG